MTTATKERPILFSGPMVKTILDGSKTQTRRAVPEKIVDAYYEYDDWCNMAMPTDVDIPCTRLYERNYFLGRCPYGNLGDRLWVKEDMYYTGNLKQIESVGFSYGADCEDLKLTAQMRKKLCAQHMSRIWSRITLEVTDVRVERVQEISQEDIVCEGIDGTHPSWGLGSDHSVTKCFQELWDSINAKTHPWESNPWVWAITFTKIGGAE